MQLHERLKFDEEGYPMMYVFDTCTDFIRTIPALAYDAKKVEDIDTAGEDHQYDETRYFLMMRPVAPRKRVDKPRKRYNPLDD
jgi:nitrate reductase beta subunit